MSMATAAALPRDPTAVLGRRIAAYLVDVALVTAIGVALVVTAYTRFYGAPANTCPGFIATAGGYWCLQVGGHLYVLSQNGRLRVEALTMLAGFLDLVVLQAFTGASVGKHLLRLRVVDEYGQGPSFLRTLARWLLLIVDSGCFLVGLITVSTTRMHQRVGDLVCRTYVVGEASAGRRINLTLYRVPKSGVATAGDRPRANGRPPNGTAPHPSPAPAPVATATVTTPRAAPRKERSRPAPAPASTLPCDAAVQWAEPPSRAAGSPSPRPAAMPGEAAPAPPRAAPRSRPAKKQRPRWSPVAEMPPVRDEVEYLEPDPRERPGR
jgi:uncharacterized RDD family membrane protein YckC